MSETEFYTGIKRTWLEPRGIFNIKPQRCLIAVAGIRRGFNLQSMRRRSLGAGSTHVCEDVGAKS